MGHWFGDCHPCLASEEHETHGSEVCCPGQSWEVANQPWKPGLPLLPHPRTPSLCSPIQRPQIRQPFTQGESYSLLSLLRAGLSSSGTLWGNGIWRAPTETHAASGLRPCQPVGPVEQKDWPPPLCGRQGGGKCLAASCSSIVNRPNLENKDTYPWQWRTVWNKCTSSVGEQLLSWKLCILLDAALPPPPFSLLLPSPLCLPWEFRVLSLYTLAP